MTLTRRAALFGSVATFAQSPPQPLNRFPRMVQEWYVARVREAEQRGLEAKAKLTTKAAAEAYVKAIRTKARACFGPMPAKTPLNPRVTRTVQRDTYTIENVIFESRPNFPVTANLYLPKRTANKPAPGVVGSCGHTANGKAGETYQSFAQGLARQGYAVLLFDPIGQGERFQYTDDKLLSHVGAGVQEHLYAANQQALVGEVFAGWRAWDGIRALDYLLTRPEVDPKHIGITGNSGGGTMTTWLCAVEDRWTMAAPSCFVTTFRRNIENELPADSEQYPWHAIAQSLDMDDFVACMAPKPVIVMGQEKDYFDARGLEESYGRLKRLYTLLGKPENIALHIGSGYHGYSQENREAMYRWFNKCTASPLSGAEPKLTLESDETLWATPKGQVNDTRPRTVFSFTREKSIQLAKSRQPLNEAQLRQAIVEVLKLPAIPSAPPDARILRRLAKRGYAKPEFATYAVETEPGIQAVVYRLSNDAHYSRPPKATDKVTLYVSHQSADRELREDQSVVQLAREAETFYAVDLRGIGESRPNTAGSDSFNAPYGADYLYAGHGLMLDAPYPGRRTYDLLRVVQFLLASTSAKSVEIAASGWGTIPATFAAVLQPAIAALSLRNHLESYASLAENETYKWPLSSLVPGVLSKFDLTDCYRLLGSRLIIKG